MSRSNPRPDQRAAVPGAAGPATADSSASRDQLRAVPGLAEDVLFADSSVPSSGSATWLAPRAASSEPMPVGTSDDTASDTPGVDDLVRRP